MIPKVIHYCWFGGKPLPLTALKCIESWKKFLPGYKIIEWNEENYDYKKRVYTDQAYSAKKYAFVSDVARLDIIYENGGIYLDTDVELIKDITSLLENKAFMGFQKKCSIGFFVNTGLGFGAEPGNSIIHEMVQDYNKITFIKQNGVLDTLSCPVRNSKVLEKNGLVLNGCLQKIGDVVIYPPEFFCPMDESSGIIQIEPNTFSIHHFEASWLSKKQITKRKLRRILGPKFVNLYNKHIKKLKI
ncbi:glycosyl transferase [Lachnoclostridium pacaense]|uniref:glycosyltransferase family 32 protein n=1 Tax=Enterocloster hominis (ex Hitch et al. 2024) TaxID=1917870 RepID=UPI001D101369|nr:glycosyltransferase [Lachnoclostridium pacaense]MCC2818945.1 glycosyl transferase [Lachnoclostridium pacaense]